MNCIVCEDCGEPWHFKASNRHGMSVQTNVMGQIMSVRKAVYLAMGKKLVKGLRITSLCPNKHCCNPELIRAKPPGEILRATYEHGKRSRDEAAKHLIKYQLERVKVTDEVAAAIRGDPRPKSVAAKEYGVAPDYFTRIRRGDSRMPRNMFTALIR